ncbi:aminoglycoside phosphotransferase [Actinocrispum wychmicini]|uniref:Aminoglycoside phosphotransferase n=2 Tax=Actinocrispum wychmicini TaxID=1213861 RepID=A0A4R2JUE1_9PSEU|nr:aminoglycoside phosphotransferase [Actinocrispum wychmicini]
MPRLAPRLPLPVPVPWVMSDDPVIVRHDLVPGEPLEHPTAAHGHTLGFFLRALHDCPVDDAIRHGLKTSADAAGEHAEIVDRFRAQVVPMMPAEHRNAGLALLDEVGEWTGDTVVHGDLGPEHVLTSEGAITGVIDFGDAHAGDAAIDLAWALNGTLPAFAEALGAAYGVTDSQRERALAWHRLGPWYEVTYGLDTNDSDTVHNGLDGLVRRLFS